MEDEKIAEIILRVAENGEKILNTATKAGVAYFGYRATNHWSGALTALVGLRLAEGGNLAAGAAGLAVLAGIGLSNLSGSELNLHTSHMYVAPPL